MRAAVSDLGELDLDLPEHFVISERMDHSSYQNVAASAAVHLVVLAARFTGTSLPSKAYSAWAAGKPVLFIGHSECELARDINEFDCGWFVPWERLSDGLRSWKRDYLGELDRKRSGAKQIVKEKLNRNLVGETWDQFLQLHCKREVE
ncbi:glycosyltransferase family protein [Nocardioides acrostichi]|uniref:hypothetical protein n=1 Tax=Nocardioides acrostichi TaxID=2784339 RepID=UPI001F3B2B29|nr:hypothetical protein [Nocardioides acrostichi]